MTPCGKRGMGQIISFSKNPCLWGMAKSTQPFRLASHLEPKNPRRESWQSLSEEAQGALLAAEFSVVRLAWRPFCCIARRSTHKPHLARKRGANEKRTYLHFNNPQTSAHVRQNSTAFKQPSNSCNWHVNAKHTATAH